MGRRRWGLEGVEWDGREEVDVPPPLFYLDVDVEDIEILQYLRNDISTPIPPYEDHPKFVFPPFE